MQSKFPLAPLNAAADNGAEFICFLYGILIIMIELKPLTNCLMFKVI